MLHKMKVMRGRAATRLQNTNKGWAQLPPGLHPLGLEPLGSTSCSKTPQTRINYARIYEGPKINNWISGLQCNVKRIVSLSLYIYIYVRCVCVYIRRPC